MTVLEMQQLFETLLQTTSPLYNDSEKPDTDTILRYLNLAQTYYIKTKYLSGETFKEKIGTLGANTLDLGALVVTNWANLYSPFYLTYQNMAVLRAEDDYWYIIRVIGNTSRSAPKAIVKTATELEYFNYADLYRYTTTINNIPIILKPVYTEITLPNETQPDILIVFDNYTDYDFEDGSTMLICLKKPYTLSLDAGTGLTTTCEMADYTHPEIVKLAVSLFEEEKYKLATKQSKKTE